MVEKHKALGRIISEQSDEIFRHEKVKLILRVLIASAIVMFCVETVIMLFLESVWNVPEPYDFLVDGLILIIILFPLNYYFIVRPMSDEIDRHHKTNKELINSYQTLERFFSIEDVLIAHMDSRFNFIRVNKAYAEADEHNPDYYIGKNHFSLFPNDENKAIFEMVVRTGKGFNINDKPFLYAGHPERGITYWDWNLIPIKDTAGQVVQMLFVLNNVTGRKKAQIALSESERRFRAVFNQTFQHMALLDPDGNTIQVNQTALEFAGFTETFVSGKPFWKLPWWASSADWALDPVKALQEAINAAAHGSPVRGEQKVKRVSGELATMDYTFKPLLDDKGETKFIIYEAHDITERIFFEHTLQENEKEIQRLYQAEIQAHVNADVLRRAVQALSGSLNSSDVLDILLNTVYRVVPFTSAHVLLLEDEDHLIVRIARGEENWDTDRRLINRRFETSEFPFLQRILVDREILSIPDGHSEIKAAFFDDIARVQSWLAIPLRAGEQVIGLCIFEDDQPDFFSDELIQWAVTLTGQAAFAIHNAWLFEQIRDNHEHLQALSRRLVEAQESERLFIARELHDDAGQALTSLMLGLRHLEDDSGNQNAVIEHCRELRKITDGVLENIHRLAVNLRPATLDHLGLVSALRQHAESVSIQHNLAVQFDAIGNIERLPGEMETAIYRIVQESLTNIVRHACATEVDILIERRDDHLIVVVEDNGIGFDPQAPFTSQLGVLGMRERAEMLGGTLTIESASGKGSTVVLEVPCQSEF